MNMAIFTVRFQIPALLAESELLHSLLCAVSPDCAGDTPFVLRVDTDENEKELIRVLLLCLKQKEVDETTELNFL